MGNNQMGPYRRPTRAAVEQALTTLALEHVFLHAEFTTKMSPRLWGPDEKAEVRSFLKPHWDSLHGAVVRKLDFILGRIGA